MNMIFPAKLIQADHTKSASALTVSRLFDMLNRQSIPFCLSHGYQTLPQSWGRDIDIIVSRGIAASALLDLLNAHVAFLSARVVLQRGFYFTLQCLKTEGLPEFVNIDFAHDAKLDGVLIASGKDVLAARRPRHNFWIPAPGMAFIVQALRLALKQSHAPRAVENLSLAFVEDPVGVKAALKAAWPQQMAHDFSSAAENASWSTLPLLAVDLCRHHLRHDRRVRPWARPLYALKTCTARAGRVINPPGVHIVFIGPDGAGKSTTIEGTATALEPLFSRHEVKGFAPPIAHLFRRTFPKKDTSKPHSLRPRGWVTSLLRAGYWTLHALISHVTMRIAKARAILVLSDRHFLDILVDPVRYRYGGPRWALHFVDWVNPKPDLIILLTGRPEVIQARKREITVEATIALCQGYQKLVTPIDHGRIVNSEQPLDAVIREVVDELLTIMQSH
jgi:thymidylate kinase